jgi:hypothetical protein
MTTILTFDELAPGAVVELESLDRGTITGVALETPSPGPVLQRGITTLIAGQSPFIAADVTSDSRIFGILRTWNGVAGIIMATDRVIGLASGAGGFRLTSIVNFTGTVLTTDQGVYEWAVIP